MLTTVAPVAQYTPPRAPLPPWAALSATVLLSTNAGEAPPASMETPPKALALEPLPTTTLLTNRKSDS